MSELTDREALHDYAAETRRLRAALREILDLPVTTRVSSGTYGYPLTWRDEPTSVLQAKDIARLALDGLK